MEISCVADVEVLARKSPTESPQSFTPTIPSGLQINRYMILGEKKNNIVDVFQIEGLCKLVN